jgi:hypothetical protein
LFDRADLDAYLGRPVTGGDAEGRERVPGAVLPGVGVDGAGVVAGESGTDAEGFVVGDGFSCVSRSWVGVAGVAAGFGSAVG